LLFFTRPQKVLVATSFVKHTLFITAASSKPAPKNRKTNGYLGIRAAT
jgi:hypothetical protein